MSDQSLGNYRSLHGLPELAGVADLAGADWGCRSAWTA